MCPLDDAELKVLGTRAAQRSEPIPAVVDREAEQLNVEVSNVSKIIGADVGDDSTE